MDQRKGRRLVLFPLPLQGHISPMLQLANILHSQGFTITIIHTSFNSPNPSSHPHLTFHFIQENLSESEASTDDLVAFVSLLNTKCLVPFRDCLAKLLADVEEEPIACLISDAMLPFTQAVADSLKLPRIVLRTGGASSFVVFAAFPLLKERGYFPIQDSKGQEPVVELPPLKIKDLPVINTRDPETLYEIVNGMVDGAKVSSGIIWNTFEDLEESALATLRQQFSIPIFPIGPFHVCIPASPSSLLTQDQSCIAWLDKQAPKSVIYVSFGSIAAVSEAEFLEIAWGLANCKLPFLWVVRPGLTRGSDCLEPLPSGFMEMVDGRGHLVKWAPQQEVLAHPAVGAFWTHNGWNSTLESICEGIPMICMPCFTDQKVNARYVSDVWKVGLQLENGLKREEIEKTIRRVMVEKQGEEIRSRIFRLKEKANHSWKQGRSSFESINSLVTHILSLETFTFHTQ
ncbi:UDP-glycosyltransferase 76F1 [Citrus sinensis]|uniref:UDP-glycosyltransferase 76F1-like n=1 Tax=Citrus sinensis TaxID=2711 RepID=UPI0003D74481|nr:UDP-glycosyltransferase 76F1-like [Citrus sinensis]XP_024041234.1 UDP-glycosyltransferase 76F1-like [Citrus x clementina]KAH9702171.1 UDP-glycosyltransferase 76F1 [Citrus sinensis]